MMGRAIAVWRARIRIFKHRRLAGLKASTFFQRHFQRKVRSAPLTDIRLSADLTGTAISGPLATAVRTFENRLLLRSLQAWRDYARTRSGKRQTRSSR
jgi:hypothetical protein